MQPVQALMSKHFNESKCKLELGYSLHHCWISYLEDKWQNCCLQAGEAEKINFENTQIVAKNWKNFTRASTNSM